MSTAALPALDGRVGYDTAADPARSASEARAGIADLINRTWTRPALLVLLAASALLYLWGLGASGWANSYYSAAAQAGSHSWKALFFGSSDAANSITVDKPPMALWVMGLSARVFGVNAWSILVPQALAGVTSVAVLFATVRRWYGDVAGLVAGAVLATTPVSTLMFRYNNPDALLVLLLIVSAYCITRAVEGGSTRWLVLAWSLVGFGFLTKMLQALLVAPAFALVYLACADTRIRRRLWQSAIGFAALVASAGWYVALVELWPKSSRPYIGGSQRNSLLELTLGYNGLGRLTGNETGSANNGGQWGETGWGRLFNHEFGSQAAWLIPAALVLLVAGLFWTRRAPRIDHARAGLIVWGGWLLVTAATFSFGQGIIHPYYTVALAPAIGALVGIGATMAWQRRSSWQGRAVAAVALALTVWWSNVLLGRSQWASWIVAPLLVVGILAVGAIVLAPRLSGRLAGCLAVSAFAVALAGPAAYSLQTASVAHDGSLPSAGPAQGSHPGGPGPRFGGAPLPGGPGRQGGVPPANPNAPSGTGGSVPNVPSNATRGRGTRPQGLPPAADGSAATNGVGGVAPRGSRNAGTASPGGLLSASRSSEAVTALLREDADEYRWVAATVGSNSASGFQLATDEPVMPIGGFNGSDPSPTLEQFKEYVAAGAIHWFIASEDIGRRPGAPAFIGAGPGAGGRAGGAGRGSSVSREIASWVASNFEATTVDGVTLYDLTA